jgi:transcriptional regulator with XRE-family HTH domain
MDLQEFCRRQGITRSIELSRKAGLTRQHAYMLWTGERLISRKMAKRLAPVLQVPPEVLMLLEAPAPPASAPEEGC